MSTADKLIVAASIATFLTLVVRDFRRIHREQQAKKKAGQRDE